MITCISGHLYTTGCMWRPEDSLQELALFQFVLRQGRSCSCHALYYRLASCSTSLQTLLSWNGSVATIDTYHHIRLFHRGGRRGVWISRLVQQVFLPAEPFCRPANMFEWKILLNTNFPLGARENAQPLKTRVQFPEHTW